MLLVEEHEFMIALLKSKPRPPPFFMKGDHGFRAFMLKHKNTTNLHVPMKSETKTDQILNISAFKHAREI